MAVEQILKELSEETTLTLKLDKKELQIIKQAAELLGIGHSTLCRMAALKLSRKTIKSIS